jgi:hypothetical protein
LSSEAAQGVRIHQQQGEVAIFGWDEQALRMVTGIEKAIIPLDLDSQGQFISLTNAMEMQLESGEPVPDVVRLLGDALLALAKARKLPPKTQANLAHRISALDERVRTTTRARR